MMARVNRRQFLTGAGAAMLFPGWACTGHAAIDDVPWLADIQRAPDPPQPATLRPLLERDDGSSITTRAEWESRREALRKAWLEFLGPMPERPPITLHEISHDRPAGCRRVLVRYEVEPGCEVDGYVLYPHPLHDVPRPGLVVFHSTSEDTIHEAAGVTGRDTRALGLHLAREGFVVFCPECFLWHEDVTYDEAVQRFQSRHPGALGMRKMLYDAQVAVDALASLDEVDETRIGAAGHSLGAKETLYLAAFDDRVAAAVASEGGIGLRFTNWHDPWYLGAAIHARDFPRDHHELLAMCAPHPFLILAGESGPPTMSVADGDRTWPYVDAARDVYRLYGEPARVGLYNHRQGHSIPNTAYRRMREWLAAYLTMEA